MNRLNKLPKKDLFAIIAIIATAVFGILFKFLSAPREIIVIEESASASVEISETRVEDAEAILTYITGEVKSPGVYELKKGDRVIDAVELAGGFTDEADTVNVNLAQKVYDEDRIYVAKIGENPPPAANDRKSELVNINTATIAELTSLPGIGNVKGQNIVNHRESFGKFKSIEELKNVSGIGEKTFDALKDLIAVD